MGAMVVTVVSDDEAWRADLEAALGARGFDALGLPEDGVAPLPLSAKPSALLLDAGVLPYGASEMGAQLKVFLEDRCPPLVCIGEPPESDDGEIFDANVPRTDDPEAMVDELVQLLPRLRGASGFVSRRDVVIAPGDVEIG
jgi:hypothetical protein